jgi:hypothetical protein
MMGSSPIRVFNSGEFWSRLCDGGTIPPSFGRGSRALQRLASDEDPQNECTITSSSSS